MISKIEDHKVLFCRKFISLFYWRYAKGDKFCSQVNVKVIIFHPQGKTLHVRKYILKLCFPLVKVNFRTGNCA